MPKTLTNGSFQFPTGALVAGGTLQLDLSDSAAIIAGGQLAPRSVRFTLDTNGDVLSSPASIIYGNDELTPSGTFYRATVRDATGTQVYSQIWILQGTSPIDLDLLVPTAPAGLSFVQPILTNPTADQTIQGFNLLPNSPTQSLGSVAKPWDAVLDDVIAGKFNNIFCVDGVKYATVQAAVDAFGASKGLVIVPSTYAGANPTSVPENVLVWDFRGGAPFAPSINWNGQTASPVHAWFNPRMNRASPVGSDTVIYAVGSFSGTLPNNQTLGAIAGESHISGALTNTPTGFNQVAIEASTVVESTGQTLPTVRGLTANITTTAPSTTAITNAYVIASQTLAKSGTGVIANVYGLLLENQSAGGTRNYSTWIQGSLLQSTEQNWDIIDSGGTPRRFMTPTGDLIIWRPLVDANGVRWADRANSTEWMLLNSSNAYWFDNKFNISNVGDAAGRRFKASKGTALVAGDFALSGWGTGASIAVSANSRDQNFEISVTAGTTPGANPTVTFTFKDLTFTTSPAIPCSRNDALATAGRFAQTTLSATAPVFTFIGTPVAAEVYKMSGSFMGS